MIIKNKLFFIIDWYFLCIVDTCFVVTIWIQSIDILSLPQYSDSTYVAALNRTSASKLDRLSQPLCKYVYLSMHVCALANINRRMQRLYTMVPSEHRRRCVIPREAHWTPVATQGRNNTIDLIRKNKNYYTIIQIICIKPF